MEFAHHKDHPLMYQHVIHVGRHELIRQHTNYINTFTRVPIWYNRVTISINDSVQEEVQMRSILPINSLFVLCPDDDSMTEEQATTIRDYVDRFCTSNFVVHCYLGVSRSAAVAKWISDRLGLCDPELKVYRGYNEHIYSLLTSVAANVVPVNNRADI